MSEKLEQIPRGATFGAGLLSVVMVLTGGAGAMQVSEQNTVQEAVIAEVPTLNPQIGAAAVEAPANVEAAAPALPQAAESAADPIPQPVQYPVGCEIYRPLFEKYDDWKVEDAMLVMEKESDCDPNAISSTNDFGLMGLHDIPILDPAENIRIAHDEKYDIPRRGQGPNYSAFYSVCMFGEDPQPKYPGIKCQ